MPAHRRSAAEWLIAACGVWLIGLGLYFILLRPALLPEDVRYVGTDAQALQVAAPGMVRWLGKVFTVMGGFMGGAGVLVVYFGWNVMPARPHGVVWTLLLAGALTVGLMSATNFALHSDFRWLLLTPVAAWVGALLTYCSRRNA